MSKQLTPYCIKTILTSSGERLPALLSRQSGIPLFDATIWAVSELRGRHVASNTILQALRSLMFLYITLDREKIDLSQRLAEGKFLYYGEIEEIVRVCKSTLTSSLDVSPDITDLHQRKVLSLEKARMSQTRHKLLTDVDPGTAAIRLNYIKEYLEWRLTVAIFRAPVETRPNLLTLRELIKNTFDVNQRANLTTRQRAILTRD